MLNPAQAVTDTNGEINAEVVDADVIILSWNRVEDTIAAIQSAHDQVDVRKRILIVDQGSDRENLAQLEAFLRAVPEARLQKLSSNSGVAGGRNIASAMGNARYIVALDSDAVFADNNTLARAVKELDEHPNLCAIGFRIENFFTGRNDETSWDYPAGRTPDQSSLTTCVSSVRVTQFAAASLGKPSAPMTNGFSSAARNSTCAIRMLNTGKRIAYAPEVAIRHKVSPEHRVFWGKGRFFYTVRNNIYTAYKYNTPLSRLAVAAAAFIIKGWRNGIGKEALRALKASIVMCLAYRKSWEDKRAYQLSAETLEYIRTYEPNRSESVVRKFRRQFSSLPHQG